MRTEDPHRNNDALSHAAAAVFSFSGEDCQAVGGTERSRSANVTTEKGKRCASEWVRACLWRCVEDRRQRNWRLLMQSWVPNRKLHHYVEFGVRAKVGFAWWGYSMFVAHVRNVLPLSPSTVMLSFFASRWGILEMLLGTNEESLDNFLTRPWSTATGTGSSSKSSSLLHIANWSVPQSTKIHKYCSHFSQGEQ